MLVLMMMMITAFLITYQLDQCNASPKNKCFRTVLCRCLHKYEIQKKSSMFAGKIRYEHTDIMMPFLFPV